MNRGIEIVAIGRALPTSTKSKRLQWWPLCVCRLEKGQVCWVHTNHSFHRINLQHHYLGGSPGLVPIRFGCNTGPSDRYNVGEPGWCSSDVALGLVWDFCDCEQEDSISSGLGRSFSRLWSIGLCRDTRRMLFRRSWYRRPVAIPSRYCSCYFG